MSNSVNRTYGLSPRSPVTVVERKELEETPVGFCVKLGTNNLLIYWMLPRNGKVWVLFQ